MPGEMARLITAIESQNSILSQLLIATERNGTGITELSAKLETIGRTTEGLAGAPGVTGAGRTAASAAGAPGKTSAGKAGILDDLGAAGRFAPQAALLAGARAAGDGLISATRGGSFAAGTQASVARGVGAVPVLGEVTGIAPAIRTTDAAQQSVLGLLGDAAAGGATFDDETLQRIFGTFEGQERRREEFRQQLGRISERSLASQTTGQTLLLGTPLALVGDIFSGGELSRTINKLVDDTGIGVFK